MKNLFCKLLAFHENFRAGVAAIENSQEVARYGNAARTVQRGEEIKRFVGASKEAILKYRNETLPGIRAARRKEAADALAFINRGGMSATRRRLADDNSTSLLNKDIIRGIDVLRDELAAGLEALERQVAVQNGLALAAMQTTESLQKRIEVYAGDARSGDSFDFRSFSVDRVILPAILGQRAAAGDNRAVFILQNESFAEIDRQLVCRALGLRTPAEIDSDGEAFELQRAEDLVARIERGDPAAIGDAERFFGTIGRGLEQQSRFEAANPVKLPAQKAPAVPTTTATTAPAVPVAA
jgi:hypothetical protein